MTEEKKDEFLKSAKDILEEIRVQQKWGYTNDDLKDSADEWIRDFNHEQLFADKK